eukprot:scaffold109495_cov26-Tisochrysis_lutea.AAC.4
MRGRCWLVAQRRTHGKPGEGKAPPPPRPPLTCRSARESSPREFSSRARWRDLLGSRRGHEARPSRRPVPPVPPPPLAH